LGEVLITFHRKKSTCCGTFYTASKVVHTEFLWGDPRKGDNLEDLGIDGRLILNWIFKECSGTCTGLTWLRIGTGGALL
jgi:hypothetical protein